MKKILLLLIFTTFCVSAQEGFSVEGNRLVWERSFPVENANIVALLDAHPDLKVESFMDNIYKGYAKEIENTCQGGSALMNNSCKFEFLIVTSPDSYTVKVKNIKILEKYGPMQARTRANPCEKYYVDDKKIRDGERTTEDISCLDNYLISIFNVNTVSGSALTSNK